MSTKNQCGCKKLEEIHKKERSNLRDLSVSITSDIGKITKKGGEIRYIAENQKKDIFEKAKNDKDYLSLMVGYIEAQYRAIDSGIPLTVNIDKIKHYTIIL